MNEMDLAQLMNDRNGMKVFKQIISLRKVSRDQLMGSGIEGPDLNRTLDKLTAEGLIEMVPGPIQQLDVFIPTKEGLDVADEMF